MIKVLVVTDQRVTGVTWWRFDRPFGEMRKQFRGQIEFVYAGKDVSGRDIDMVNIVLFSRPSTANMIYLMNVCKSKGRPTIVDVDDDLINVPKEHPLFNEYYPARQQILECYALADYIFVSTEQLLYSTDCLNKGAVIPNAILESDLPKEPAPDSSRWAWRGGLVAQGDLYAHRDWYNDDISMLPKEWWFIGYAGHMFLKHRENFREIAWSYDVEQYMQHIKRSGINVIWKPLQQNKFNEAKSNIAWIEATMGGGVCLTNFAPHGDGWDSTSNNAEYVAEYECARLLWQESVVKIRDKFLLPDANQKRFEVFKMLSE